MIYLFVFIRFFYILSHTSSSSAFDPLRQDVNLIGTVGTLEDIYAGDDATGQEFFGLAPELVLAAVEELVAAKKAILVPGKTLADLGIKYLSC